MSSWYDESTFYKEGSPSTYAFGATGRETLYEIENLYHELGDFIHQVEPKLNSQERQDILDIRDQLYRLLR